MPRIGMDKAATIETETCTTSTITRTMQLTVDWKVVYPSDSSAVDSDARNLTFLYKDYPQTLIMPITGAGTDVVQTISGTHLSFGNLWSLVGKTNDVTFLYRESAAHDYYPQVLIGTPSYTAASYIANALKTPM